MDADRLAAAGRGRDRRGRFVLLALAIYLLAALWATWPASRHLDGGHYLARPAAGAGEAAAGDHLQLGWAFWLPGHQLERGNAPWGDPYTFRPTAEAPANLGGWLLGIPFWPLQHLLGVVWAYNLVLLLTFVLAGGITAWWLRSFGLARTAALVGGLAFALAPYRIGQSTGHLLGLIAFLLPALLLALERRRLLVAGLVLVAVPLSGQVHLALGAIPLALGYAWARVPRALWWKVGCGAAAAIAAGVAVQLTTIRGSIGAGGRSFAQVERYSAEVSDLVTRGVGAGVEELVFLGWLLPLLALAGIAAARAAGRGLAWFLLLATAVPVLLALGSSTPLYEPLWHALPPLRSARVPERLMPIACLALAASAAFAVQWTATRWRVAGRRPTAVAAALLVLVALDLRVPVFGAVVADRPSAAYAAIDAGGTMLELPVIRPDLHHGSVFMAYARQAPHERPQGYSTIAPPAADRLARRMRGLSCGRGSIPEELDVRVVVVHRGVYEQTGFFAAGCADRAERMLEATGWTRLTRDGAIASWAQPPVTP